MKGQVRRVQLRRRAEASSTEVGLQSVFIDLHVPSHRLHPGIRFLGQNDLSRTDALPKVTCKRLLKRWIKMSSINHYSFPRLCCASRTQTRKSLWPASVLAKRRARLLRGCSPFYPLRHLRGGPFRSLQQLIQILLKQIGAL